MSVLRNKFKMCTDKELYNYEMERVHKMFAPFCLAMCSGRFDELYK